MVHINDKFRSIATGDIGTVVEVTAKRAKIRFTAPRGSEEVWYSLGQITGAQGYVQYAYLWNCGHSLSRES